MDNLKNEVDRWAAINGHGCVDGQESNNYLNGFFSFHYVHVKLLRDVFGKQQPDGTWLMTTYCSLDDGLTSSNVVKTLEDVKRVLSSLEVVPAEERNWNMLSAEAEEEEYQPTAEDAVDDQGVERILCKGAADELE